METQPTVTDLNDNISDLGEEKVETIIKQLINHKNLPYITELTHEQIIEICKLKHLALKYGKKNFPKLNEKYPIEDKLNTFIENFTLYMCSHKRKRVGEFLDGLKSQLDPILDDVSITN